MVNPWPVVTSPVDRIRAADAARARSDYVFVNPGWNIALTLLTCGIFGLYLFYQLMRRDRDHIRRRYDLLDAANTFAWQLANERGLAEELRPAFERNAVSLATLQRLTTEFRDPVIWLVLALVGRTIAEAFAFVLIDQDLDDHDRAEGAIESELAVIYQRLGAALPTPDPTRIKGRHNYVGRVIATVATCGLYELWRLYDVQVEGNRHLAVNGAWDDALVAALRTLS